MVTVVDDSAPSVWCTDYIELERTGRRAHVTPLGLIGFDCCTTSVTHKATDYFGNVSTCSNSVTVSDTLAPEMALGVYADVTLEYCTTYVEAGASATDQCYGDLTSALTVSGTVNTKVPGTYVL